MSMLRAARGLYLAAAVLLPAAAYVPPTDHAGPLTLRIEGPQSITSTGVLLPLKLYIENSGAESLRGQLHVIAIDGWTVLPGTSEFEVQGHGTREFHFSITAAAGSYNALYPIHAFATCGELALHAVLIAKTELADAPAVKLPLPWKPVEIAADSGFALWRDPVRRVVLQVFGKEPRVMPAGWDGSEPLTRGTAQFGSSATRGESRQSISMHEPYAQGPGTIFAEYPLALPRSAPIKLRFANAVRDDTPGQAAGDGVTFRVRVLPWDAAEGRPGDIVFERHTAAKTWQDGEADLTRFAGQRIRLQLESHPGPRNNTTNDQSFWAEPTLVAGTPPAQPSAGAKARMLGPEISVTAGARGLLDSTVSFGRGLSFHGFQVRVLGDALEDWRSPTVLTGVRDESDTRRYRVGIRSATGRARSTW